MIDKLKQRIAGWLLPAVDQHYQRRVRRLELDYQHTHDLVTGLAKRVDGMDHESLLTRMAARPTRPTIDKMIDQRFQPLEDQLARLQGESKNIRDQAEYAIKQHKHDRKYFPKDSLIKELNNIEQRLQIIEGILRMPK